MDFRVIRVGDLLQTIHNGEWSHAVRVGDEYNTLEENEASIQWASMIVQDKRGEYRVIRKAGDTIEVIREYQSFPSPDPIKIDDVLLGNMVKRDDRIVLYLTDGNHTTHQIKFSEEGSKIMIDIMHRQIPSLAREGYKYFDAF